jgi:predicted PurR-regulated permease PerM
VLGGARHGFNVSSLSLRSSTRPAAGTVGARQTPAEGWDARRIFLANLVVLGVATCFAFLYRFAAALFILFAGIALGMAVKPGVEQLRRRGVPRWAGALVIYAALGTLFAGVIAVSVPVVVSDVSHLLADAPQQVERLRSELASSESRTLRRIAAYLPPAPATGAGAGLDAGTVVSYGAAIGRGVLTMVSVLLLGYFWTLEGERRTRALVLFAPLERRRAALGFVTDVERTVGAYLRGQSLVCLIIGVLAFVLYHAMGLPHAGMLGLVYALGEAVPVLGPIVGTATAAIAALVVQPSLVPWVVVAAAGLQLCENYVLIPRVMVRVVGVNPFVTLLAITAFGSVLGVAGAVLAIPMAAIVQLVINRWLLDSEAQRKRPPAGRDHRSVIRYGVRELVGDLRKRARAGAARARSPSSERLEDALEGIAVDLDRILGERAGGRGG